jgi:hypothetical protein
MRVSGTGPMRVSGTGPLRVSDTGPMRATGTGPQRTAGAVPSRAADTGPMRVSGTGPMRVSGTGPMARLQPERGMNPVIVPAGAEAGPEARLPIFDSLESAWFHRRGRMPQRDGQPPGDGDLAQSWTSAGDAGWRAANGAAVPAAGPVTAAGLPRRVPQANLVPGSAGTRTPPPVNPALTAEHARNRLSSFQQGVRRARAAIKAEKPPAH